MLDHLHTTIRTFLLSRGGLDPQEVDVRFERPTRQWVESLARPTINLFLFDMAEQQEFRNAGAQTSRNGNRAVTQLPPRRVELRYLVSAPSSAAEDEYTLLWRAMAVLLRYAGYAQLPPETLRACAGEVLRHERYLGPGQELAIPFKHKELAHADVQAFVAGAALEGLLRGDKQALSKGDTAVRSYLLALAGDPPITAKVGPYADAPRTLDLWGGLDVPLRTAFLYAVTVPLDLQVTVEAPLVLTRTTRFLRPTPDDEAAGKGIGQPPDEKRAGKSIGQPPDEKRAGREAWFAPLGDVAVDIDHDGRAGAGERDGLRFQVAGVVRDRQGHPLPDVVVGVEGRAAESALDEQGREKVARSDGHGRFKLTNLRRGDRLWVRRGTDERQLLDIVVPSDVYDIKLDSK